MQIGQIVSALMEQESLTLEGLAARVRAQGAPNVKYQHIQQLIDIPSRRPRYLPELARAFGMTVEQFLAWRPGRKHEPSAQRENFSASHPVGIDPTILAASNQLVRLACDHLEIEHDPESAADAQITLLAYAYLLARGQSAVTPDNLVDFTKALRRRLREAQDDERSTGAGGSGASTRGQGTERKAG